MVSTTRIINFISFPSTYSKSKELKLMNRFLDINAHICLGEIFSSPVRQESEGWKLSKCPKILKETKYMKMNELCLWILSSHSTLSCLTLNVYARHNCVFICKTKNAVHFAEVPELIKSVPKHKFKTAFKQLQHIKTYIKAYKIN